MSAKYPEWYELPKERWQETALRQEKQWSPEFHNYTYTGRIVKKRTWRDSQRQKLYNAENHTKFMFPQAEGGSEIVTYTSINEIRDYVFKVMKSRWVVNRFGQQTLPEILGKDTRTAYSSKGDGHLNFPPKWSWNQVVVLHEITHWIHPIGYGTSHGRFFARAFLELSGHEIGPVFRRILKENYRKWGVKFTPFPAYTTGTLEKKRQLGKQLAERYVNTLHSLQRPSF